jgi:hypothetical protein
MVRQSKATHGVWSVRPGARALIHRQGPVLQHHGCGRLVQSRLAKPSQSCSKPAASVCAAVLCCSKCVYIEC